MKREQARKIAIDCVRTFNESRDFNVTMEEVIEDMLIERINELLVTVSNDCNALGTVDGDYLSRRFRSWVHK